jgi:hypothetical protein
LHQTALIILVHRAPENLVRHLDRGAGHLGAQPRLRLLDLLVELEARLLLDALGFLLGSCQQTGFFALPF